MPKLSICIVNWNTRALLLQTLRSVYATAGDVSLEIIVVDNGSSDGSLDAIRAEFPSVQMIANSTNAGFARANNQAIAAAHGDWCLLLNSDTIIKEGALQAMLAFAMSRSDCGVVGCKLLNEDGSLQESWAAFPSLTSELLGRNIRTRRLLQVSPLAYDVDWVGGACMLVRSDAIRQVGDLDEGYFMYSEETDWCYRIRQAGWRVYYLADAEIVHLGGGSASRASAMQLIRLYGSKLRFFNQHYGPGRASLLRAGFVAVNTLGLIWRFGRCTWRERSLKVCRDQVEGKAQLIRWLMNSDSTELPGALVG